jgi:hypothetical protein
LIALLLAACAGPGLDGGSTPAAVHTADTSAQPVETSTTSTQPTTPTTSTPAPTTSPDPTHTSPFHGQRLEPPLLVPTFAVLNHRSEARTEAWLGGAPTVLWFYRDGAAAG